jgi:endonuclease/exonuclease/phosphatase family metal-dependent hydrolase
VFPVLDGKCVIDRKLELGFLHFPMSLPDRLQVVEYLENLPKENKFDLIMGDFNTFPDDGGPEILNRLDKCGYQNRIRLLNNMRTFHAFAHDLLTLPSKKHLETMKLAIVIKENDDGTVLVRPVSWLDQCMSFVNTPNLKEIDAFVIDMATSDHTAPSDHFPILACCKL